MNIKFAAVIACALATTFAIAAEKEPKPNPSISAIQKLSLVRPSANLYGDWKKPTVIRSATECEKFFEGDNLNAMKSEIDWDSQIILIFAWRGSGQDKLKYEVEESSPEKVTFSRIPGRTKDLRPHINMFALRNDVTYSVKDGR